MNNDIEYKNEIVNIGIQKNFPQTDVQTNYRGNCPDREGPLRNFVTGQVF